MSGTRHRGAALAIVAVLALVTGCNAQQTPIFYYWVDAEDGLMIQVVTGDPDLTSTHVKEVTESADSVVISVESVSAPVPMTAVGYSLNLPVELAQPLGDRRVIDALTGSRVPLCRDVSACEERGSPGGNQ